MSFWNLSEGDNAIETTTKEFDGGGGDVVLIPKGSSVLAMPDDVKWAEDRDQNEFLSIRWTVLKPETYLNRKIWQKLWLTDDDPSVVKAKKDPAAKRDKAKKMLAAIDANAGGKLGRKAGKPTDDDLAVALINKQMVLRVEVWSIEDRQTGETKEGNWVAAVSGKDKAISVVETAVKAKPKPGPVSDDLDDDVPF